MKTLGIFGPIQLIFLVAIVVLGIIIPVVVFSSRAKHKARANTLDDVLRNQQPSNYDRLEKLERLNKLRESGALSDVEFDNEKKKILE